MIIQHATLCSTSACGPRGATKILTWTHLNPSEPIPEPAEADTPDSTGDARVREVLARLAQGFYDRPDVRDVIARRVARDLQLDIAEG